MWNILEPCEENSNPDIDRSAVDVKGIMRYDLPRGLFAWGSRWAFYCNTVIIFVRRKMSVFRVSS